MDSTEITIRFLRACGPASLNEISNELFEQCIDIDSQSKAQIEVNRVLKRGLETGLFEYYDGYSDAFIVKTL